MGKEVVGGNKMTPLEFTLLTLEFGILIIIIAQYELEKHLEK